MAESLYHSFRTSINPMPPTSCLPRPDQYSVSPLSCQLSFLSVSPCVCVPFHLCIPVLSQARHRNVLTLLAFLQLSLYLDITLSPCVS